MRKKHLYSIALHESSRLRIYFNFRYHCYFKINLYKYIYTHIFVTINTPRLHDNSYINNQMPLRTNVNCITKLTFSSVAIMNTYLLISTLNTYLLISTLSEAHLHAIF